MLIQESSLKQRAQSDTPAAFSAIGLEHVVSGILGKAAHYRDGTDGAVISLSGSFGVLSATVIQGERNTKHALAVDDILETPLLPAGTRAARPEPEPWAAQSLGAQVLGKVQIRNAKEMIWEIVSVDRYGTAIIHRSKAGNQRRELIAESATSVWPAPGRPERTRK